MIEKDRMAFVRFFGYTEYAYFADRGSQDRHSGLVVAVTSSSSRKGAQVLRPTGSVGREAGRHHHDYHHHQA